MEGKNMNGRKGYNGKKLNMNVHLINIYYTG